MLDHIAKEHIKITNFGFFSSIESTPLLRILNPQLEGAGKEYLQTHISFFCRGEHVGTITVEGSCALEGSGKVRHASWLISKILARKEYWRNDPDESQEWINVKPVRTRYTGIRAGSDIEEAAFNELLKNACSSR